MDEGMKLMYKLMYGLDTSKCVEVKGSVANLDCRLDSETMDIRKFAKENTVMVSIDNFSTKDLVEGTILFKNNYVEFVRIWGLVNYTSQGSSAKPVGYITNVELYNGFPTVIDPEKFVENPQQTFMESLDSLLKSSSHSDMFAEPIVYRKTTLFLLKDFYDAHIVEKTSNIN